MNLPKAHIRLSLSLAGMVVLGLSSFGAACSEKSASSSASSAKPEPSAQAPTVSAPPAPVASVDYGKFRDCTHGKFGTPPGGGKFKHRRSKMIAKLGRPAHSAQDIIVKPGEPVVVPGKFAYGRVSKDLEDETVVVFLDTCESYGAVGTTLTDDDGRTAFSIPDHYRPGIGFYNLTQVMRGDASTVKLRLTVAPAGTRVVVFDVDGTLTVGDDELADEMKNEYLEELYSGKRPPEAYPDGAALTKAWHEKGYLLIYMTGRPYWLAGLTRKWLEAGGFAPGHLHTTDRSRDALPTESGVGEFKASYLKTLIDAGYVIDYAYGNTESDIFAYAKAGVPATHTHIIGEHGGKGQTQALSGSYTEHLHTMADKPSAKQPF